MLNSIPRPKLSFANVTALLALFVALGGSAYAVQAGSINSRAIKDNAVKSKDLRDNNVKSRDIKDGNLTAQDLGAGSVGREALAERSVGFDEIDFDAVSTEQIEIAAVGTDEIAQAAVGREELADGAVGTAQIAIQAIGGDQIAERAIDREHVAISCGQNRVNVDGLCFDRKSGFAVDSVFEAQDDCTRRGGRLPTPLQLRGARLRLDLGDGPNWTDSGWFENGGLRTLVVGDGGGVSPSVPNVEYESVCVFEPFV